MGVNNETQPKQLRITKLKKCLSTSDTSAEYSSLSELVSDHLSPLKSNKFSDSTADIVPTENNSTKGDVSKLGFNQKLPASDPVNCNESLATRLQTNVLKEKYKQNVTDTWNIDLSVALKDVDSAPSIKRLKDVEQFDMPFIDCEIEPQKCTSMECKMDISGVLHQHHCLKKSPSKFGKILSLKCKRTVPYKVRMHNYLKAKSTLFHFDTPSPDDLIRVHLRRK